MMSMAAMYIGLGRGNVVLAALALMFCVGVVLLVVGTIKRAKSLWITGVVLGGAAVLIGGVMSMGGACILPLLVLMLCAGIVLFVVGVSTRRKALWITGVILGGLAMIVIGALAVVIAWFIGSGDF